MKINNNNNNQKCHQEIKFYLNFLINLKFKCKLSLEATFKQVESSRNNLESQPLLLKKVSFQKN